MLPTLVKNVNNSGMILCFWNAYEMIILAIERKILMSYAGWSMCEKNSHRNHLYMHGLWRSGGIAGLNHLEYADCREDALGSTDKQECYNANWWGMYVRS